MYNIINNIISLIGLVFAQYFHNFPTIQSTAGKFTADQVNCINYFEPNEVSILGLIQNKYYFKWLKRRVKIIDNITTHYKTKQVIRKV